MPFQINHNGSAVDVALESPQPEQPAKSICPAPANQALKKFATASHVMAMAVKAVS